MSNKQSVAFTSLEVWVTSEAGDQCSLKANIDFTPVADGKGSVRLEVFPENLRQPLRGVGSSFTQSTAYVLAQLPADKRKHIMQRAFSPEEANFAVARTHIGSCDFSVLGKYNYAPVADDTALQHFSVDVDQQGFEQTKHPTICDPSYDLLPMIKEANAIKAESGQEAMWLIASAWTAPPWMKDINDWYIKGTDENNHEGTGGRLKKDCYGVYADYLIKYLEAYKAEGVDVSALTPVNEPYGNNGQWESMHFSATEQADWIADHFAPRIKNSAHSEIELYTFDHNRDALVDWVSVVYEHPAADAITGAAVHWYESTNRVFEEALEEAHKRYPDKALIHTEGCIDDLGKPAPPGILDPEGYQESDWFGNDAFWWNPCATDWAYTATWPGVIVDDHPMYAPTHRYAINIIVSLNHWLSMWLDWNMVLDSQGGPNHVGNFCGAPIMVDIPTQEVYFTPVYYILAQISRAIQPGDRVIASTLTGAEDCYACAIISEAGLITAHIFNAASTQQTITLISEGMSAQLDLSANALTTIRFLR